MTTKAREPEPAKPTRDPEPIRSAPRSEPERSESVRSEPTKPERSAPDPVKAAERPALGDPDGALKREAKDGMCVADPDETGIGHFADGRAVPGTKVCSAHEISHNRDGSPRRP